MKSYAFVKKVNNARLVFAVRLHTFKLSVNFLRVQDTLGINSGQAFDVQHGIFWDFRAGFKAYHIIEALGDIQERYGLGDIWVFRSGDWDSFRAMCPTVLSYEESRDIIMQTSLIDPWFVDYMIRTGYKTIRILPKNMNREPIKFVAKLKGSYNSYRLECRNITFILSHMSGSDNVFRSSFNNIPDKSFDKCRISQMKYVVYETAWLRK